MKANKDHHDSTADTPPVAGGSRRRLLRWALIAAVAFHLLLLGALLVIKHRYGRGEGAMVQGGSPTASGSHRTPSGESSSAERQDVPQPQRPPNVVEPSPQWEPVLERRIEEVAAATEALTPEEQADNLKQQIARLEQVSSQQSVDQMAQYLRAMLGTESRATQPAKEPIAGPFDFDSAQIHEIQRHQQEDGSWEYRQVLLDAQGRTYELAVDPVQGERLYELMETVKKSPLAAAVYRQMVLPTLDKMLKQQQQRRDDSAASSSPSASATQPPLDQLPVGEASEGAP